MFREENKNTEGTPGADISHRCTAMCCPMVSAAGPFRDAAKVLKTMSASSSLVIIGELLYAKPTDCKLT